MNTNQISRIANMIGEPSRTAMLVELMDGRSLTASELARAAGITAQTGSAHLAQLLSADLLRVSPRGRHRYYRLASLEVARMLETIMQVASRTDAVPRSRLIVGPKDAALRAARTCYDHLAGRLGVVITQRLTDEGGLVLDDDHGYLTDRGHRAIAKLGIDVPNAGASKQGPNTTMCRPCLDWSERRFHIAGQLARQICNHCLEERWLMRRLGSRAVDITPTGQAALQRWIGMELWGDLTR